MSERVLLLVLSAGLVASLLTGIAIGPFNLSLGKILATLTGGGESARVVPWNIRLPRVLAAALVGAALAGGGGGLSDDLPQSARLPR